MFLFTRRRYDLRSSRPGRPTRMSKKPDKIDRVKSELEGAVNVMRNNLGKVLDRGDKLEDLEAKSRKF